MSPSPALGREREGPIAKQWEGEGPPTDSVVNRSLPFGTNSRKPDAIVAANVTAVTAAGRSRAHRPTVMKIDTQSHGAAPDWTYSVPKPQIFSPLWLLYLLSKLSIPIAIVGVLAAAQWLGWIELH